MKARGGGVYAGDPVVPLQYTEVEAPAVALP